MGNSLKDLELPYRTSECVCVCAESMRVRGEEGGMCVNTTEWDVMVGVTTSVWAVTGSVVVVECFVSLPSHHWIRRSTVLGCSCG